MKAIVHDRYGSPDVLRWAEVDRPVLKPREVLVRVHASSVNMADRLSMRGMPYIMRVVGGSLGAVSAQHLLRHKTRKEPFRSILLSIVILQSGLLASLAIMPDWPVRLAVALKTLFQNPGP